MSFRYLCMNVIIFHRKIFFYYGSIIKTNGHGLILFIQTNHNLMDKRIFNQLIVPFLYWPIYDFFFFFISGIDNWVFLLRFFKQKSIQYLSYLFGQSVGNALTDIEIEYLFCQKLMSDFFLWIFSSTMNQKDIISASARYLIMVRISVQWTLVVIE